MKSRFYLNMKEFFWNGLKKITNTFSNLTIYNVGNGYIKAFLEISSTDNFRIEMSKSCFYAIRVFDITNNRNKNNSTCIMKEIQVSKYQSSISFPVPINKGVYYFEFGYRKKNGEWRKIASQHLNLGYRIKKENKLIDDYSWFDSNVRQKNIHLNPHDVAYQLSSKSTIGGSEQIRRNKNKV